MTGPKTLWIAVTLALVAMTQSAQMAVRSYYEPTLIRALRAPLSDLPTTIEEWTALSESPQSGLDERLFEAIGAEDAMTRIYESPQVGECSVHLAAWHASDEWMPHPPYMCYEAAGFAETSTRSAQLPGHQGVRVCDARYSSVTTGAGIRLLYWYQIGEKTYHSRDGARVARRSQWGHKERPPLVKVLMQWDGRSTKEQSQRVMNLADKLYEFAKHL